MRARADLPHACKTTRPGHAPCCRSGYDINTRDWWSTQTWRKGEQQQTCRMRRSLRGGLRAASLATPARPERQMEPSGSWLRAKKATSVAYSTH